MMSNKKNKNSNNNKDNKEISNKKDLTPLGDLLWKLPEDDNTDVDDVFERPIIPGTSGVEC